MKYGNQLERESVPEWSYHNLDYNSLKHEIKVHTTRDQATAITIPGHHDVALRKFEDALYKELCSQHDRVDLFVTSKADEVLRRLGKLPFALLHRWASKNSYEPDSAGALLKRQSRFLKFERELLRCGEDIQALSRFANAQIIAFHKILKKYRKWTGSTTLSSRFNEIVLSNPKSFTKRSFSHLQERHDEIYEKLQKLSPSFCEPSSPSSVETTIPDSLRFPRSPQVTFDVLPPPAISSAVQIKYWNEYDDGSEAGGPDEGYTIYVDPNEEVAIPGLKYIKYPFVKVRDWLRLGQLEAEQQPICGSPDLPGRSGARGYGTLPSHGSTYFADSDEELGYTSSDGFPSHGYASHFALPSLSDQRMRRYRERVLMWGTVSCFAASFVFLGIAGILISTGRHKLRVEVDSGATVGAVVSLFCACSGLGMTLYREDALPLLYRAAVWVTFVVTCVLNGMLFVLVLGNTAV
ncbi:Uncharacterized protein ESCO_006227 [Escovopsis weberi]|uniref:SPX domain-containing protein n=1 Tax=Escovopsis weberi TaxID=150374 RepID=A0A0M9VUS2_ESCWE|nr:Uncharacterized protein ESCO_006227 [Escovopsis weberi]